MRSFKLASCKKCGIAGKALVVVSTLETLTGKPRQFYVLCLCREAEYFDTEEEAAEAWNSANAFVQSSAKPLNSSASKSRHRRSMAVERRAAVAADGSGGGVRGVSPDSV